MEAPPYSVERFVSCSLRRKCRDHADSECTPGGFPKEDSIKVRVWSICFGITAAPRDTAKRFRSGRVHDLNALSVMLGRQRVELLVGQIFIPCHCNRSSGRERSHIVVTTRQFLHSAKLRERKILTPIYSGRSP